MASLINEPIKTLTIEKKNDMKHHPESYMIISHNIIMHAFHQNWKNVILVFVLVMKFIPQISYQPLLTSQNIKVSCWVWDILTY
jgi:hypothetical protein